MRDAFTKLLTPIRRIPGGIRLAGSTLYSLFSLSRLFTDKLKIPPVFISIKPQLNNNGLALPLSNKVVLGETYTPDAPADVSDVSVGYILGHEIGHIHDYRGIERGLIHRFFMLFPFLFFEYLKNIIRSDLWTNILFRATMWFMSYTLYRIVLTIILPWMIPHMLEVGIPVVVEVQSLILTALIWNTYMLGIKLRSEIYANFIACDLLAKLFKTKQGAILMREEKFYLVEIILYDIIFTLAFVFPQVALLLVDFFTSILGFYAFIAASSTLVSSIGVKVSKQYGKY